MFERTDMRGAVTIELTDASGALVHREQRNNRIVLAGRRHVAGMFAGVTPPPTKVTHVGVGTGATAPDDDQTKLVAERAGRSPITQVAYADVIEGVAPTAVKRTRVSLTAVFDFAQANDPNVPLREAALFTAAADGVMYNRVVLDPVVKTNAFKLTVLWDIVF